MCVCDCVLPRLTWLQLGEPGIAMMAKRADEELKRKYGAKTPSSGQVLSLKLKVRRATVRE